MTNVTKESVIPSGNNDFISEALSKANELKKKGKNVVEIRFFNCTECSIFYKEEQNVRSN